MSFNSLEFALFLPLVFLLYWSVAGDGHRRQNLVLLGASCIFYGWWDWRFLGLMAGSVLVDFLTGLLIYRQPHPGKRKALLLVSLAFNLGILLFFKYFNFFVESFADAFTLFGTSVDSWTLRIILPIGISFYTFQTLSYSIDVYRNRVIPTTDLLAFASFVSFFPQLVAGPVERATDLLPQMLRRRTFNYALAVRGLRQILWGLFKKVAVADSCAIIVNDIFGHYEYYSGSTLLLGAILFAGQIYCDFSGYSDMAIGLARLFGIKLSRNFAFPIFARNIREFWQRWHITLTQWFRDYLFNVLPGSRRSRSSLGLRILVVFLVTGLWHGANWTFVVWGGLNGVWLAASLYFRNRTRGGLFGLVKPGRLGSREVVQIITTQMTCALLLVFFRSPSIGDAMQYLSGIFSPSLFDPITFASLSWRNLMAIPLLTFMVVVEWRGRHDDFALEKMGLDWPLPHRWMAYAALLILSGAVARESIPFIYFHF
ncbi:D-alanyl-lipoteichoic acid acyltransferase DltB (MBOAT superfamily) [Lewinella marina]|uniref:Membrane-bound O-acyltransferase family protein n=1 Tax=Neolewinella marina TaxID=438751 RepID=A0A2G0CIT8_9BACT|nr:MBOAT family O-acyltransferase [Neolewinella marina]NJB84944.1 D-alanyl-lipoteichoic acid acyltransferase DltB (MBOAT superfamily) [Neolewinella marina]PHK99903.1 membrane-bound O-acyltransferase family protein [Neolewinella marina]